jgi:glycosyltransferase involved in cell wall biosynthesis
MRRLSERPGGAPFKLLLVTDEMEVGGTQRQLVNLARYLCSQGVEVHLVYFRERSFLVDELAQAGVQVLHLPKRARLDLSLLSALMRQLREGGYDAVHAFAFSAELWTALALRGLPAARRPALISSVRGVYDWYGPAHWAVKRWVTRHSARVVANSRGGAAYAAERLAVSADRLDVVYNGIETVPVQAAVRARLRTAWGLSAGAVVALFVGRLVEVKDLATLLRAVARLADAAPQLVLMLAGDGPLREALAAQAAAAGLGDRVRFLGERNDVPELLEASDLLVLSSRQEGLSNAILEAMRGARPVIASAVGGNLELVQPGTTGLLFQAGDDADLAAAMAQLAGDAALRRRLGQAAAARVRQSFSVAAMGEALRQIYVEAAERAASSNVRPASQPADLR